MRQYLESTDVINSIKLLLKHPFYSDKLILVVEGTSDIRFFRSIFDYENIKLESALLHKDLKVKTSHIYSNLSDNSGMWSA